MRKASEREFSQENIIIYSRFLSNNKNIETIKFIYLIIFIIFSSLKANTIKTIVFSHIKEGLKKSDGSNSK